MANRRQSEFRKGQKIKFRVSSLHTTDKGRKGGLTKQKQQTLASGTVIGFEQQTGDIKLRVRLDAGKKFEMLIHPTQVIK